MTSETNPNKLSSRHTPGPWNVKLHEHMVSIHTGGTDEDIDGVDPTICGIWARAEGDDRRPQCEANAHIISAAPEAIEFIADRMGWFDNLRNMLIFMEADTTNIDKIIADAEIILKKAYNF